MFSAFWEVLLQQRFMELFVYHKFDFAAFPILSNIISHMLATFLKKLYNPISFPTPSAEPPAVLICIGILILTSRDYIFYQFVI